MTTTPTIFVFGSNLYGLHGGGAARHAAQNFGAVEGEGIGRTGNAYAIPTMDEKLEPLPLECIKPHIDVFIDYAYSNPRLTFLLTRIGCGIAGYDWDDDIGPLFSRQLPPNVTLLDPQ